MVADLLSFFTRLPARRTSIEKTAKYSYLLPLLGILIGVIVGTLAFFAFKFLDRFLATIMTLVCLYFITGLNHLDGLADFADGIYACGSREKKIKAMKDLQIGIAGITFTLFVILLLLFAIFTINGNFFKIIIVEVCAKTAMLSAILFGKPMKEGIGRIFVKKLNKKAFPFSILFSLAASFLLLQFIGILAVLVSILSSFFIVMIAHRNFGAINGDVIGAINELSRVTSLLVLVIWL